MSFKSVQKAQAHAPKFRLRHISPGTLMDSDRGRATPRLLLITGRTVEMSFREEMNPRDKCPGRILF